MNADAALDLPPPQYFVYSDVDDEWLVLAAQDGSALAFEMLVRRYRDRVFGLAYRMTGQPADAEDIAQETFITAWRRLDLLTEPAAVRTWLFRIATRCAYKVLKARKRATPFAEIEPVADHGDVTAKAGERSAELQALSAALARLTARQRAVWLLIEAQGLSYAETAAVTSLSETAVRGQLFRSRARLAEVMEEWH